MREKFRLIYRNEGEAVVLNNVPSVDGGHIMHISNTNQMIEAFVAASEELGSDARHRHVLRESLRSLVRQAKAEQWMEVRRNAARASGFTMREYGRLLPRMRKATWPGQGEFEF